MKLKKFDDLPRWAQVLLIITCPVWFLPAAFIVLVVGLFILFGILVIEAYDDIVSAINRS